MSKEVPVFTLTVSLEAVKGVNQLNCSWDIDDTIKLLCNKLVLRECVENISNSLKPEVLKIARSCQEGIKILDVERLLDDMEEEE